MPTYRGEQNKFDYLIPFPPYRSVVMLCGKRETDKHPGSISFVLLHYSLQLTDYNIEVRAFAFFQSLFRMMLKILHANSYGLRADAG
jgi:hypothetical protein